MRAKSKPKDVANGDHQRVFYDCFSGMVEAERQLGVGLQNRTEIETYLIGSDYSLDKFELKRKEA